jgi:hypothetical protein
LSSVSPTSENSDSAGAGGGSAAGRRAATTRKYIGTGTLAGIDARRVARQRLGVGAAAFAPQRRPEPHALRVPRDRRERDAQQALELGAVVLVAVVGIHVAARFGVFGTVGRREHQHAVVGQHARELGEHARLVGRVEVLDRLERDDDVDAGVGQRQLGGRALHERQVADRPVGLARMRDRRTVDVDAGHLARDGREQRAAVASPHAASSTRFPAA